MSEVSYSPWTCWLFSPDYGEWAQFSVGFVMGVVTAPYSTGILWVLFFLIIWEVLFAWKTSMNGKWWSWQGRLCIFFGYILGWIFGKMIVEQEIFD
jgi:hypothetical protein